MQRWLACALFVLGAAPARAAGPAAQQTAFHSEDGTVHTLDELRGHAAVVNFWATWCGPCREEMPRIQKLADAYQGQGVRFVAISLDSPDTQDKIARVVEQRRFHVAVWTGADETTLRQLNMGELVPATMILDDKGEVVGRIEGEASEKDVRSRLDWLLNGRVGKPPKAVQKNDW